MLKNFLQILENVFCFPDDEYLKIGNGLPLIDWILTIFSSSHKACMSKYSAGGIYYYPSFHHIHNPVQTEKLQKDLKRYLTRKIGFEAVMRIRCTKGIDFEMNLV